MRVYKSHCVRRRSPPTRGSLARAILPAWRSGFVRMGMHKLQGLLSILFTLCFAGSMNSD